MHQEVIVLLNIYAPNKRASERMKQKLIELKEVDRSIAIARNINFSLNN